MLNPDKYIRKYFFDTLNNIDVNGNAITIHDYRVPTNKSAYILMQNQSSDGDNQTKCDTDKYTCRITLDVVTIYPNGQGSRLLADDIKERVMNLTQSISIDNFHLQSVSISYPDDLHLITPTQNIFRKLINYELTLTQIN